MLYLLRVTDASPTVNLIYSEEAVEYGELETFLRLKDTWDESIEETRPMLPTKPIGVPGASSPSQMAKPAHRALFNASPSGGPSSSSPLRGAATSSSSAASALASALASSPSLAETKKSLRTRTDAEFDVSEELTGYGLQGVKVTDDDLLALVEELGLGGEEAGDLVKGLSDHTDNAVKVKEDEATGGSGGGGGGSEQPESNEALAEAKPVAREEAEFSAEGDGVEKAAAAAETEVAETDAGATST
jgi:hypothetical protein